MNGSFIVGSGRCGSTLLSNLVNSQAGALSLSEFLLSQGGKHAFTPIHLNGEEFWTWLSTMRRTTESEILKANVPIPEIYKYVKYSNSEDETHPLSFVTLPHIGLDPKLLLSELKAHVLARPSMGVAKHYTAVIDFLCRHKNKKNWVERSGGSITYVKLLSQHFPQSKILHLYRNGIDCARSMSKHPVFFLELARILTRDKNLSFKKAQGIHIPIARFGAMWSSQIVWGCRHLMTLPKEKVMLLSFDDLCESPTLMLNKMFSFLDVGPTLNIETLSKTVRTLPSNVNEINHEEMDALRRSCFPGENAIKLLHEHLTHGTVAMNNS